MAFILRELSRRWRPVQKLRSSSKRSSSLRGQRGAKRAPSLGFSKRYSWYGTSTVQYSLHGTGFLRTRTSYLLAAESNLHVIGRAFS